MSINDNDNNSSGEYKEPLSYLDVRISEIPDGFSGKVRITGHIVEIDGITMSIDDGTGLISGNIGRDVNESLIEEGRTVRAFIRIQNLNTEQETVWIDFLQDIKEIDLEDYWKIVDWERALKGFPSINGSNLEQKDNSFF